MSLNESLGDEPLRKAFSAELLAVEDDLRAKNFAVWKVFDVIY